MFAEALFFGFAVLSVLGAIGLVLFRHPMNGAMSLVVTMISLAGLYALLSAKLIFALQLIVYAGAIMSLILFIIMFLNIQESDLPKEKIPMVVPVGGNNSHRPYRLFFDQNSQKYPRWPNNNRRSRFWRGKRGWAGSLSGLVASL